jgi:hypothetical protein
MPESAAATLFLLLISAYRERAVGEMLAFAANGRDTTLRPGGPQVQEATSPSSLSAPSATTDWAGCLMRSGIPASSKRYLT